MFFLLAIVGIGVLIWVLYDRACDRAVELADGSPPNPKGGLLEKWAMKIVPAVHRLRKDIAEEERRKKGPPILLDPWLQNRSKQLSEERRQHSKGKSKRPKIKVADALSPEIASPRRRPRRKQPLPIGDSGTWAQFEYVDADGVVTDRNLGGWREEGPYVIGYDQDKHAMRTFRKDRISDFVSG